MHINATLDMTVTINHACASGETTSVAAILFGSRSTSRRASLAYGAILIIGARRTILLYRGGKFWRAQIAWPNSSFHYVGRSASKRDAIAWIAAYR
jgi:hypothetical protein